MYQLSSSDGRIAKDSIYTLQKHEHILLIHMPLAQGIPHCMPTNSYATCCDEHRDTGRNLFGGSK